MPHLLSAYRKHHSTETALMKVISDKLDTVDDRKGPLDLSAAFNIVDNDILLKILDVSFGIGGSVLEWFRLFLTYRTQAVVYPSKM